MQIKPINEIEQSPNSLFYSEIKCNGNFQPRIQQQLKLKGVINFKNIKQTKKLTFDQPLDKLINLQRQSSTDKQKNCFFFQANVQWILSTKQFVIKMPKSITYQYLHKALLVIFIICCVFQTITFNQQVYEIGKYTEIIIQFYFSFLIITNILLWKEYNILILIVDIALNCVAYTALAYNQNQISVVRRLKAIRAIKLFLIIFEFQSIGRPFSNFFKALKKALKILIPAFMFITFYAIVGLYLFKDLQFNKCRDPSNKYLTSNWTVYSDQIFLCGQKSCPIVDGIQYQCLNPIDYGVQPNYSQLNNIVQGNSLMQYGNIFYSVLSTTKQIFITGSSRLMILNKQAMNSVYVLFYYLSLLYLVSYIYLNIFYGLMTINQQNQQKAELQDNKQSGQKQLRQQVDQNKQSRDSKNNMKEQQNIISQNIFQIKQYSQKLNQNICQNQGPKIQNQNEDLPHKQKCGLQKANSLFIVQNKNQIPQNQAQIQMICFENKNQLKNSTFFQQSQNSIQCQNQLKQTYKIRINQLFPINASQNNFQDSDKLKFQAWNRRICVYKHIVVPLCSLNLTIILQNPSSTLTMVTSILDLCFYFFLILEIGAQIYINKKWKQSIPLQLYLDVVIAIFSTVGLLCQLFQTENMVNFLIQANIPYLWLRSLKYLRIFTLLSQTLLLKQAKIIFRIIIQTIYTMRYITLLWFIVLLSSSIIGYHLFQLRTIVNSNNQFDFSNGSTYPISFDTLPNSMSFTSLIFFNEEWDYFMFQQFIGSGFEVVCWIYFLIIFGLTFFSKYFMALTIKVVGDRLDQQKNFTFQQDQIVQQQEDIKNNQNNTIQQSNLPLKSQNIQKKNSCRESFITNSQNASQASLNRNSNQLYRISQGKLDQILFQFKLKVHANMAPKIFEKRVRNKKIQELKNIIKGVNIKNLSYKFENNLSSGNNLLQSFLFLIQKIVVSSFIRYLNIFMVILSCGSYINFNQNQGYKNQIQNNLFFRIVYHLSFVYFNLQMITNMLVYGFIGQNSYFKKSWLNCINFVILFIQALSYIEVLKNSSMFTSLLTLRALRIFYIIEFAYEEDKNMRLTIVSFIKLIPKIVKLLIITLGIYGFFAIWFANLYRDRFSSCQNYNQSAIILTQSDCYSWGGDWITDQMNANNFLNALLFLFLLATTQGWSSLMIHISTLRQSKQQPSDNYNLLIYMACQGFFFIGNMFLLNLFIGLTIYNFNKIKQEVTGESKLNKQEKMWLNIKSQIYRLKPVPLPTPCQNKYSILCFDFLNSQTYLILQIFFSLFFIITMSMFTTNQSYIIQKALHICLIIYCLFHTICYLIHWIAFGLRVNFWGKFKFYFDTFTVLYSVLALALLLNLQFQKISIKMIVGTVIGLHMMKSIFIINKIKSVNKMTSSLISVLPQTKNMLLIILTVLYIYTVIGMELFSYLKFNTELNSFDQNYTTFPLALYSLIKFSTMQSPITQIQNAASAISPNFVCFQISSYSEYLQYGQNGCGSQIKSYIFFLSFHVIYSLVLISTLMAIIFDAYSQVVKQEEALINKFQLQQVKLQWSHYDPEAKGFISYRDFWLFTSKLMKIYSFNKDSLMMSNATKQSFLKELNISIYEDQGGILSFQFHEVIQALTKIYLRQKSNNYFQTSSADKLFQELQINTVNCSIKKSSYNSSQVLSLILLKSGLKVWRRKAMENGNDKTSFQERIRIGHLFIVNQIKNLNQQKQKQQQQQLNSNIVQQKKVNESEKNDNDIEQQKYDLKSQINKQQSQKNEIPQQNGRRVSLAQRKQIKKSRFKDIHLINPNLQQFNE